MKNLLKILACASIFLGLQAYAESEMEYGRTRGRATYGSGQLQCRDQGFDRVCAYDTRGRFCKKTWSEREDGDPMYRCQVYLGLRKSNHQANRHNYYCRNQGFDRVCAVDRRHGQCTRVWSEREDGSPMRRCQLWTGERAPRQIDRSYFYCKSQGFDRVCAIDRRHGQCTHAWSKREDGDPMRRCQQFIGQR